MPLESKDVSLRDRLRLSTTCKVESFDFKNETVSVPECEFNTTFTTQSWSFDEVVGDSVAIQPIATVDCRSWRPRWSRLAIRSFSFSNDQETDWLTKKSADGTIESKGLGDNQPSGFGKPASKHPAKRTRIQPPDDVIRVQDRLFYLLQPPLESVLSGRTIRFRYQPFPYQFEGIAFLYPRQFAVLADEMGLGKTMQAISTMRLLLHAGEIRSVLLICPKPLATNWVREFETWAPEIPVEVIGGDPTRRRLQWVNRSVPVKIANYELLIRDHQILTEEELHFDLVVLDEAQRIKNSSSTTSQVVKSVSRSRNWALTGTPIENSIEDVVGIFDFLSEGTIRKGMAPRQVAGEIGPYMLRRTKDQVLDDMPPKLINDVYLDLHEDQWASYERAEKDGVVRLNEIGDQLTVQHVFELVLRLKQICNADPVTGQSTKIEKLSSDLEEVVASGQKAIVFSQWVKSLDQIADRISQFNPLLYHGKIPAGQRDAILSEFRESPDRHVILMSYGTGSVGLNLQFCQYVFLYDRWWNPAVEDQAINRAHRLGSVGGVTVSRVICTGTVEERIHDVLEQKRELFQTILGQTGEARRSLDQQELFGLFDLHVPGRQSA